MERGHHLIAGHKLWLVGFPTGGFVSESQSLTKKFIVTCERVERFPERIFFDIPPAAQDKGEKRVFATSSDPTEETTAFKDEQRILSGASYLFVRCCCREVQGSSFFHAFGDPIATCIDCIGDE